MPNKTLNVDAARILIVDDNANERRMIEGLLETQRYEILEAGNGIQAIQLAETTAPHCILLDIVMPGIDGIETCRRIKNSSGTEAIPVIVITAHTDRESRLNSIAAGADDFLSKPFDAEEIKLRVKNAVRTKRLYERVRSDLVSLQKLEDARDSLTHMLVHDLRQPLTGIKAYADYLATKLGQQGNEDFSNVARKVLELANSQESMIALILDVTRLEGGQMPLNLASHDLIEIARKSIETIGGRFAGHDIAFLPGDDPIPLNCDKDLISRVIENLLSNATKFSSIGEEVTIAVKSNRRNATLTVTDRGPGIPPEYHALVFEKFGQVQAGADRKRYSSGLGLTFCKLAVEAHGGEITLESAPGKGSTFRVVLPVT